jgi:hypothetical protein
MQKKIKLLNFKLTLTKLFFLIFWIKLFDLIFLKFDIFN